MEEFRLDPVDLGFALISGEKGGCRECMDAKTEIKAIEFRNAYLKVYEMKDRLQPSKYELSGNVFKRSNAHGYEEILVENDSHSPNFSKYSADDIEELLLIISGRLKELRNYKIGSNISVSRYLNGHDYCDLVILPIPKHVLDKCYVCVNARQAGNRAVYKTEHVIAYIPFSPKKNDVLRIAPVKHLPIEDLDSVIAFDIANLIKKITGGAPNNATINIRQSGADHFEISLLAGDSDPVDSLGITRLNYSPEETAKKMSEKLNNGR